MTPTVRDPHIITAASLRSADTVPSLARVLAGELSERLGHRVHVAVQGDDSSADTLREWSQGLLDCAERYPGSPLDMIFTGKCEASDYAESLVDTGVLVFDQTLLAAGARRFFLDRLAGDVAGGWRLPAAATPMGVAVHEFGHFVDLGLALPGWHGADAVPGHPQALETEVGSVLAMEAGRRLTSTEVGSALGRHALIAVEHGPSDALRREFSELVADAFTDDHMNGPWAQSANARIAHRLDQAILLPGDRIASPAGWALAQQSAIPSPASQPDPGPSIRTVRLRRCDRDRHRAVAERAGGMAGARLRWASPGRSVGDHSGSGPVSPTAHCGRAAYLGPPAMMGGWTTSMCC